MSEFDFKPNPKSISEEEWGRKYEKIFGKEEEEKEDIQEEEE